MFINLGVHTGTSVSIGYDCKLIRKRRHKTISKYSDRKLLRISKNAQQRKANGQKQELIFDTESQEIG